MTCLLEKPTGVDNYVTGLVCGLAEIDDANDYTLFVNCEDRIRIGEMVPARFRIVPAALRPRPTRLCFQQGVLPVMEWVNRLDVVHSPAFIAPLFKRRARHVVTVHDMTFFSRPQVHTRMRASAGFRWAVETSIRSCNEVAVPSEHTKADLLRLLPRAVDASRIVVTRAGIHNRFQPATPDQVEAVRRKYGLPEDFVLFVGTIEPRKNLARVIEAFRAMAVASERTEHLVIIGDRGWERQDVRRQMGRPSADAKIHVLGFVPNEDLPALYSAATVFVFPSLEEGFGFPPLEAMACGTAVITSDGSSLAENTGDCAELVDPTEVSSIQAAMARLLADSGLRQSRVDAGLSCAALFRWTDAAKRMRDCYERIAAQPRAHYRR